MRVDQTPSISAPLGGLINLKGPSAHGLTILSVVSE
jgi:hypothetical protein